MTIRFKRVFCFMLAAMLTFTAFTELAQTDSYAAPTDGGLAEEASFAAGFIDEAKDTKKKKSDSHTHGGAF